MEVLQQPRIETRISGWIVSARGDALRLGCISILVFNLRSVLRQSFVSIHCRSKDHTNCGAIDSHRDISMRGETASRGK